MIDIKRLRKFAEEATQTWIDAHSNIPFYVVVNKPAPSLSKHDLERPNYWKMEDGYFVATFTPKKVLELLDRLEKCEKVITFSIEHLKSMENYSVVSGTIHQLKDVLKDG